MKCRLTRSNQKYFTKALNSQCTKGTEGIGDRLTDAAIHSNGDVQLTDFSEYHIGVFISAKQRIPNSLSNRLSLAHGRYQTYWNYDYKIESNGECIQNCLVRAVFALVGILGKTEKSVLNLLRFLSTDF